MRATSWRASLSAGPQLLNKLYILTINHKTYFAAVSEWPNVLGSEPSGLVPSQVRILSAALIFFLFIDTTRIAFASQKNPPHGFLGHNKIHRILCAKKCKAFFTHKKARKHYSHSSQVLKDEAFWLFSWKNKSSALQRAPAAGNKRS